ncbi:MAG: trimethylamine methyltransferase family protein [Chloroflexi bacterium]|nr:trimethylamine methyltransferase family protein [Chloroflexota bacterium]
MSRETRRAARRTERTAVHLLQHPFRTLRNPWRPLEILAPEQIEAIHHASLHILENIGLDFMDDEALRLWQAAGADVNHTTQRVRIDRGLLMETIAHAPAQFTWAARNPAHNVMVGGNHLTFGPPGGMVYVTDLERGRRQGTMADYEDLVRLCQMCPVLHYATWEQVTPQDVPVNVRHLHRLMAGLTLSDKVVMESAHGRIIPEDALAMMRLVFGGELPDDPVIGDVINVNSPLRYDERMLGGLISYARAGQVTFITPFILAGAMSPVTMAAALAQQNAEALAGVALTQLVRRGAPVVYGGFTTNVDMRSGAPAFGTPEGAWAISAGAQLARYYHLPYRASGSLTNSQTADAQSAYETMWNLWPVVMSHANLIMHAAGWLEGGLTVSLEKFVIDVENLAMFAHFLEGFAVNEDTLALGSIAAVGPGGHHFGTEHTQAHYATAFYQSSVANRQNYDSWAQAGREEAPQRAHKLWKTMLAQYEPPPLDPALRESLTEFVAKRTQELAGVALYE